MLGQWDSSKVKLLFRPGSIKMKIAWNFHAYCQTANSQTLVRLIDHFQENQQDSLSNQLWVAKIWF